MNIHKKMCCTGCSLVVFLLICLGWNSGGTAQGLPASQVVVGTEGWLFLKQELRFLNTGPFWVEYAESASQASRADAKDPTPAIVAFHKALAEKGVTLLLVPVPPKALLYPEHVPVADKDKSWGESLDKYYTFLREQGVQVLDLREGLKSSRGSQDQPVYCREDTHWSGTGITVAADLITEQIKKLLPEGDKKYSAKWSTIQITGDLRQMLDESRDKQEKISIRSVSDENGQPPQSDPLSPVLVLGDSHVLVFHDGGDMYARGAGVSDQLTFSLGMPVDVIGVRGSGATPARLSLYRKAQRNPEYWKGKKVVIWCFAAREFTETDGWRVLPIEP